MDDTVFMPELDKAIVVIKNYVEILEKKVVELGTENKDLKIQLHDLHNQISVEKKREGFSGYYIEQPEWSSGFRKRVEKADVEAEKESSRERWTNMRIKEL
jgi:DNA integrity scanning protein DisA with diadenylate cyclase activity